ncbi:MAG: hypothetical protein AABZ10_08020, partial [Nitrospirota bacterium]
IFCHKDTKARRKQCINQISKCKLQNCGVALGHDFIALHFAFYILHSVFFIRQTLCLCGENFLAILKKIIP